MDFNPVTEEASLSTLAQEPGIPPALPQESWPLLRKLELLLLLGVAIGPSLLTAAYIYFVYGIATQRSSAASYISFKLAIGIVQQAGGLALLCYILFRQGRNLRDIGFSFRWGDVPVSVGLFVLAWLAYYVCYLQIYYLHFFWSGRLLEPWNNMSSVLGAHISIAAVLFIFINSFFEELIVRAYVMSEISSWTRNIALAGIVSVAIQASYHLYQGVPNAVSIAALFAVFSIYYGISRRIMPVILAHLYLDILGALYLFLHH